jgi:hypothetical protein
VAGLQIGGLYLNGADPLSHGRDPATSSNFAASTLHACRRQLAEEGTDANYWLMQQIGTRGSVELIYGLQVAAVAGTLV